MAESWRREQAGLIARGEQAACVDGGPTAIPASHRACCNASEGGPRRVLIVCGLRAGW